MPSITVPNTFDSPLRGTPEDSRGTKRGLRHETFVSIDVETDGPCPGLNSLLSIGAAAFHGESLEMLGSFQVNLEPMEGAHPDTETQAWWSRQPEHVVKAATEGALPAIDGMALFGAWVDDLPGRPVAVAAPAGFDFTFVYWYAHRFLGRSPFSRDAYDVKTYASALLGGKPRSRVHKSEMAKRWPTMTPHTHIAIDDAIEQGEMFVQMVREARASLS